MLAEKAEVLFQSYCECPYGCFLCTCAEASEILGSCVLGSARATSSPPLRRLATRNPSSKGIEKLPGQHQAPCGHPTHPARDYHPPKWQPEGKRSRDASSKEEKPPPRGSLPGSAGHPAGRGESQRVASGRGWMQTKFTRISAPGGAHSAQGPARQPLPPGPH